MKQTKRSLPSTGIYLDKAHPNKDGKCSVKIRVTYRRKSKFFRLGIYITPAMYETSFLSQTPRGDKKILKMKLNDNLRRAEEILDKLSPFTFSAFEKHFYRSNYNQDDLELHFKKKIDYLKESERYSSADAYSHTLAKLLLYFMDIAKKKRVSLTDITVKHLRAFESWMLENDYSITTVGIYLRSLRHIMNKAIKSGDIPQELYPFGKEEDDLYTIPEGRNLKKALSIEEVKKIIEADLSNNSWKAKARDFWLISLFCNGININDMLRWKHENYNGESISFIRRKTRNTKRRTDYTTISISSRAKAIMDNYINRNGEYIFDLLEGVTNELERRKIIRNFTRYVNQHMKGLAEDLDIHHTCSLIYCRHTWATLALNKGIGIEYISEGLSHNSLVTTRAYIKGFDVKYKAETTEKIFEDL